ncbi:MAG: LuxR C-terminal-related transcriptional regulator [Saprospiraceae bacterium]
MEKQVFKEEFNKMFNWLANESPTSSLKLELDLYKKLWNIFLVGDSFWFILNHKTLVCDHVSEEVSAITGYEPFEFDLKFLMDNIHPEDQTWLLTIAVKTKEIYFKVPVDKLTKYKLRYDLRYKKKNGDYSRLMYQGVVLEHDDKGKLLRTLGVFTDITYLKNEGRPVLSLIGMEGEPSYLDFGSKNIFIESKEELTQREKQILHLLIEGKLSKEIGGILHISKQTVDTHRKNMLRKHKVNNTGELIGKAIKSGWL